MKTNALLKSAITSQEVESLIAMRVSLEGLKKRYRLLEDSVKTAELNIISRIESGTDLPERFFLQIKIIERRYPHWKAHFAELAGRNAAEEVLRQTPATITKTLVIME